MKWSDESRVPLYVSPFLSSTSCTGRDSHGSTEGGGRAVVGERCSVGGMHGRCGVVEQEEVTCVRLCVFGTIGWF